MNIRRAVIFAFLAACFSAFAFAQPVVIGEARTIRSAVLNEDRTYRVFLPESYKWAADRRYPVLYLLDGKTHFLHTYAAADYLAQQGDIPETIVVALDSTVRIRDFTQSDWKEAWVGGGGAPNFKRFLSTELIPNIEKTYRTNGFRTLVGHSAGGQFVLYTLTSESTLFRAYLAFSPSLDWHGNLPAKSLEQSFDSAQGPLNAFLYVARSDDAGRALEDYQQLVGILKTKSPKGLRWHSAEYPEETHGSVPLVAQIDALRRLYAGYRFHNDNVAKGLAFAEKHFEDVSRTLGWPTPIPESVINSLAYEALATDKKADAIALFKRAVAENPNSASAYDGLADGYAESGEFAEALKAAERASALAAQYDHPSRAYFAGQVEKLKKRLAEQGEKR